jgi:hypothetical protein
VEERVDRGGFAASRSGGKGDQGAPEGFVQEGINPGADQVLPAAGKIGPRVVNHGQCMLLVTLYREKRKK